MWDERKVTWGDICRTASRRALLLRDTLFIAVAIAWEKLGVEV